MIRRKKNVKKGIQFCLMVCGASGTGMFIISIPHGLSHV
jgi:septin family protein